MTRPIGTLSVAGITSSAEKVGIDSGGGGVNVGKCVGGISTINCAARVGSIVGVVRGVGVGGGSTIGSDPLTSTRGVYTHATPPGAPGYAIWIHRPPSEP